MILLDNKRIERTLKRMAYQILEDAHSSSVRLIGLNSRGLAVANKLKTQLEHAQGSNIPLHNIQADINDEFTFPEQPGENEFLVIVDDVIFSGGSMFSVMRRIPELSAFKKVCVAVLVDRGHRKLPVLASIVGVDVPTKLNEHIELILDGNEPKEIILTKK